jgi:hypothetical protein
MRRDARGARRSNFASAAAAHYHNHSEREGSHSLIGSIFLGAHNGELNSTLDWNNKKHYKLTLIFPDILLPA